MSTSSKRKAESGLEGQFDDCDQDNHSGSTSPTLLKKEADAMSALATAASRVVEKEAEESAAAAAADNKNTAERPIKKAKASPPASTATSTATPPSAQDAINNALTRLSKPSTLSDYEKCSIFPQKLMQLLKNEEAPDAIWWLEDGESFAIEQEQFTKVMNKVSRTSKKKVKLDSILRNLYRWGFKKLKDRQLSPNVLAYSHPKFKRDASVELQTFSKKAEPSPSGSNSMAGPPATALARALSARANAGYGEGWNEEGAADKTSMMGMGMMPPSQFSSLLSGQQHPMAPTAAAMAGAGGDQRMMYMLQQQQHQQRHMLLQQEFMLQHQEQHRHQQMLLEAAAAEQYQRLAGAGGSYPFPPNPYQF